MTDENHAIAEMVRSGKYFQESRAWYSVIYLKPISERAFYLTIALLSCVIAAASINAVLNLLPLTSQPAIAVYTKKRMDEVVQRLVPLKKASESLQPSLVGFYVTRYVTARERYTARDYAANARFVRGQSSDAVYATFSAAYSSDNPNSLAATLGDTAERRIEITDLTYRDTLEGGKATVHFSAQFEGTEDNSITKWTAVVDFQYKPLTYDTITNPETGAPELRASDPQFQVVRYELQQNN